MTKQIVLVINERDARSVEAGAELRKWCATHDVVVVDYAPDLTPDLIVALGGDGTILRAVSELGAYDIPILGVKFGRLGFLSGAPAADLLDAVEAALDGRAAIESRAVLEVRAHSGDVELGRFFALNEVLVGRGAQPSIITTRLLINGHHVYTQRGDGLIASTATGSTAYALSAGGPILSPGYRGMALVPLASHTLVNRAIVTAPEDEVRIELPEACHAKAALAIDGRMVLDESKVLTQVDIGLSERSVLLVKLDKRLFFDTLATEFFGPPPSSVIPGADPGSREAESAA